MRTFESERVIIVSPSLPKVIIHTEPNSDDFSTNPREYYNSGECCRDVDSERSSTKTASNLLNAFNYGNWRDYCLAHLFTYFQFPSGLLGLANIASSFRSQTGGICSRGEREGGREGGRERGREEAGRERGREGGREGEREGGRQGGREGSRGR